MKIVIIGGTGLIGSKLVTDLTDLGHEVLPASPGTGVDTITGEGLDDALAGARVVVDVSNSPSFEDQAVMEFFKRSTTNLLAAEAAAGVAHHVALSIVGTERPNDIAYFHAKRAQEDLIEAGPIPWSIVHVTQFFEFVGSIAASATEGDTVRLPTEPIQPIAADDVAAEVGKVAVADPLNGMIEAAGPEKFPFNELVEKGLASVNDPRIVIGDPDALYFGGKIDDQTLIPGDGATIAETTFADWLDEVGVKI